MKVAYFPILFSFIILYIFSDGGLNLNLYIFGLIQLILYDVFYRSTRRIIERSSGNTEMA